MIRELELDQHPLVEELNDNNKKIKEYIGFCTKIELRNMIIIGFYKGYENFVEIYVNTIPERYGFKIFC